MKTFYYLQDREPIGPFTIEELRELHLAEKINLDTLVSQRGGNQWVQYSSLLPAASHSSQLPNPPPPATMIEEACPDKKCRATIPLNEEGRVPPVCPKCFYDLRPDKADLWSNFTYAFSHYASFKGRATRAEFWSYTLIAFMLSTPVAYFGMIIPFASVIYSLVMLLPSFAVSVRRFHDVGLSGTWVFLLHTLPVLTFAGAVVHFTSSLIKAYEGVEPLVDNLILVLQIEEDLLTKSEYEAELDYMAYVFSEAWSEAALSLIIGVGVIPLICALIWLLISCKDSSRGVNRYGVSPKYPLD